VSKLKNIDPSLLREVAAAVEACWNEGSPVAGSTHGRWEEIAHIAIRRIRSFSRRGVSENRDAQIKDIAKGFVQSLEEDALLVGPLIIDYRYVAEKSLDAFVMHANQSTTRQEPPNANPL
jgi:hypothetical protein